LSSNRSEKPKEKAEDGDEDLLNSSLLLGNVLWLNVLLCLLGHVAGLYGFYLGVTGVAKWPTLIWSEFHLQAQHISIKEKNEFSIFELIAVFLMGFSGFGITGGAHRLWAHRSYKAKLPFRLLVAVGQTMALQVCPPIP
jgi:stearoyl-CoA desaturase (delta-9 desaturase)